MPVVTGLDVIREEKPSWLRSSRVLLVANNSSCDRDLRNSVEVLRGVAAELKGVVTPEHGFYASRREGEEVRDSVDEDLGIREFSWYSGERTFKDEWLEDVDFIVYDLQDGGVRFHTYLSTLRSAIEACSRKGVRLVVLDRPNPIRGDTVQGNIPNSLSVVCPWRVPIRHGLTPGEFARLVKTEGGYRCDLQVVAMRGWRRWMWFDDTGLPWVQLSPNTPTLTTSLLYPGTCLFEGTSLSVGRGTTKPFELIGAPWLKAREAVMEFNSKGVRGVKARYTRFTPWYSKYAGVECKAVQLHVLDRNSLDPVAASFHLLEVFLKYHTPQEVFGESGEHFDLLMGDAKVRQRIYGGERPSTVLEEWKGEIQRYYERIKEVLLYGS